MVAQELLPLADTVWVVRDAPKERVASGIIVVPKDGSEGPCSGVVMGVGPECVWLKPGDRVAFRKYAGVSYSPDPSDPSVEWLLLDEEDDIHAIIP